MLHINAGKQFEADWKASVPDDVYYHRLSDPAQAFSGVAIDGLRFSSDNPFDCMMYRFPYLCAFELKSTIGTSMSFWREDFTGGSSPMIKKCQILGLTKASKYEGVVAGLVLNFRETAHTYFVDIRDFTNYTGAHTRKSVNENDINLMRGLLIPQTLKRTKYKYDVGWLLDGFKQRLSCC